MSLITITCPTGCTSELPDVDFDLCAPDVEFGEIKKIYFTNIDQPLTDWTDLTEWTGRLDQTSADVDAIRTLWVSGDKPVSEVNALDIDNDRKVYSKKNHTINFTLHETNITNHDLMRQLECGGQKLFWFETEKYLHGGTAGIEADIDINHNVTRGAQELNTLEGMITWKSTFHYEKIESPFN